jgi:hypothetical protein
MDGAKSYFVAARGALGARFVQDPTKGDSGAICIGAVDPDGDAATRGIVAGMVLRGVGGIDVDGMPFNDVMLAAKAAKKAGKATEDETWELNLAPPWDLEEEEYQYWAGVLQSMGLEMDPETSQRRKGRHDTSGTPVEAAVTHPEPVKYSVRSASTVREGPESSSRKVGEHPKGTVIEVAHEQSNSAGVRVVYTITPPPGTKFGGFMKVASSKGKPLLERVVETPPPTPDRPYKLPSLDSSFSLSEGEPPQDDSQLVEVERIAMGEITCYQVLNKCSIRSSISRDSEKLGDYYSGYEIKAVEQKISPDGLVMVRSITQPNSKHGRIPDDTGGWVKIMSHKGKRLLEKKSAAKSTCVILTGGKEERQHLTEVVIEGSGSLGLTFRQDQFGKVEVYKIAEGFVADGIEELQSGMKLHSISGSSVASLSHPDVLRQINERWSLRAKITMAFTGGDLPPGVVLDASRAEEQAEEEEEQQEEEEEGEELLEEEELPEKEEEPQQQKENDETSADVEAIAANQEVEQKESEDAASSTAGGESRPAQEDSAQRRGQCPSQLWSFLVQHGCESYAKDLCSELGVTSVEDLVHLRPEDLDGLQMKVIPRRRLELGIEM